MRAIGGPDATRRAIELMARGCLRAICTVRELRAARVYSPNPDHRRAFARSATETMGLEARAVDSAEEAVRGADIVLCATDTATAVYSYQWLSPGAHVTSI